MYQIDQLKLTYPLHFIEERHQIISPEERDTFKYLFYFSKVNNRIKSRALDNKVKSESLGGKS